MKDFDLYNDISKRTGGEIYIGVVGPVRTGKSTFIKRFMDILVLPRIEDEHEKIRTRDELPQSSGGKTITTTEPKFIPKDAAQIEICEGVNVKVRLIDCVGYMVEGAAGHMEEDTERMVKTPWFQEEIPFTKAAEIGTRKVIQDHSTIGIVITTDGSFGELPRNVYRDSEEQTIMELKHIGKPFVVLLNTTKPFSEEAKNEVREMESRYEVKAIPVNIDQLKKEDITEILEQVMYEFPISVLEFYAPKWMDIMSVNNPMKQDIMEKLREIMTKVRTVRDLLEQEIMLESEYVKRCKLDHVNIADGTAAYQLEADNRYYYDLLSSITGEQITGEYQLMQLLQTLAEMKKEYNKVLNALESVRQKGYGVVTPDRKEITLEDPTLIRHGGKFGVKIKAQSPSIHMIKANIETEIAPIVGTQQQAQDLIRYISDAETTKDGIWETNIFGKTVEQLVNDGITSKISMIGEESQVKLQDTMQKIVNDSSGGMVCIII
ncbi:MAG: stage IV sporulation protein A [Lachnospiraceae bacterium]|nr:stage IV sporulation protein A [Lachnospiraceae bacterium]